MRSTKVLRQQEIPALFHVKQPAGKHSGYFNEASFNETTAGAETMVSPAAIPCQQGI